MERKSTAKAYWTCLTLTPPEGTKVRIRIEGPDAAEAMHALEQMMRSGLDEAQHAYKAS
jgi:phosphotransferase system HPr-like phosphotransfer protein